MAVGREVSRLGCLMGRVVSWAGLSHGYDCHLFSGNFPRYGCHQGKVVASVQLSRRGKLSQGMVKGYNMEFSNSNGRRGRTAIPHKVILTGPSLVRKARESSIGVKGANIFNLLPVEIRNTNGVY